MEELVERLESAVAELEAILGVSPEGGGDAAAASCSCRLDSYPEPNYGMAWSFASTAECTSLAFPLCIHMPYMDQIQQNNIQILGQLRTQFQFPKKPIQILLSISAFSILLSLSLFFPLFSSCIAAFSSRIFTYTTDRNYIFLFCNGLLAFLIKNSSAVNTDQDHRKSVPEKTELGREEVLVEFKEEKGKENNTLTSHDESEEEEEDVEEFIVEEEEEEEEEGEGLMSAEELNKKCEEFIRKMREGIKIEAQN
ncbi:hypothetical protein RHSIM_Rhsim06G0176100 [Rhododendron simsii]|uniref:Uncharacterized protein n=1 Tax=Rhododendron simsii TaxID=118357 RepID=A0A834GRC9_RHOSS|nr:hypothetical protein RHSIM_Rhsim06G0176100 [Rhododendron simsii]